MKNQLFTFKKFKNEWSSEVNPKFIFEMITTYGLPREVATERISSMTSKERFITKLKSWKVFAEDNNIDIKPIKEKLEENKDKVISYIDKI